MTKNPAAVALAELSARKRRKLTAAQRQEIRHRWEAGESALELSIEFAVSRSLIYMVARGER